MSCLGIWRSWRDWLTPYVLEMFRRRIEFTTTTPGMDGSFITGTKDRLPTEAELAAIDDREFFIRLT